jgi:division protein CdvB (Snf7/Vps24/ESCRT-III family)
MKRILALALALVMMVFAFAGCGSDNSTSDSIELSKVLADVNDNGNLSSMKTITNTTDLQKQFDIDPEDVSDFIAEVSEDGDFPTAVVVTKAASDETVQNVNDKLNTYLNEKLSNAQSYNPEQVSTIKECKVQDNGLYSMLVIAENHNDIEEIIENYF